jgi:hypothetical protein
VNEPQFGTITMAMTPGWGNPTECKSFILTALVVACAELLAPLPQQQVVELSGRPYDSVIYINDEMGCR